MVVIILNILKIIGITLLCVLGLILTLALLILLLPIRYKLSAEKKCEGPLNADFRLTYFFHILRAYAHYSKELTVKVKVLWFTLFEMKIPEEKKDDESSSENEEYDFFEDSMEDDDTENVETSDVSDVSDHITESVESNDSEGSENSEDSDDPEKNDDIDESNDSNEPENEENSASEEVEDDLISGDIDFISKIKYKVNELCDKIDEVRSEYRYYRNVLNSNEAAYSLRNLKKHLFRILIKVFPRRLHAELTYGFDSPDITGKVYGLYCIFRNRFDKSSVVIPEFNKSTFEGLIFAKGHFNLWCILFHLLCIVLNPSSIKIFRSVRRHTKKNNTQESGEEKEAA